MPAQNDDAFYKMLNSIAETTRDEDAVHQNKRIKEAEFAEDSREPNESEVEEIRRELMAEKAQGPARGKPTEGAKQGGK